MFNLSRSIDQQPPKIIPTGSASRKIQLVYYLSRRGLLEQPHLLEVSISSTEGLYLRDVKKRLTIIRGKSMPSSFSWSYKRSYKNGYVWQDLCDDDLIFPANGCDYVLKGCSITDSLPNKGTTTSSEGCVNEQGCPADRPVKYPTNVSKVLGIEKRAKNGEIEYMKFPESDVNATHDFDHIHDDLISTATCHRIDDTASEKQEVLASRMQSGDAHKEGNKIAKSQIVVHEYKKYATVASAVDIGFDAATQTDDSEIPLSISQSQYSIDDNSRSGRDFDEKPTELEEKGEISPPPCSSSCASTTASGKLVSAGSPGSRSREKYEQVEQTGQEHEHRKGETGLVTPRVAKSSSDVGKSARDNMISVTRSQQEGESLAGSKSNRSGSGFRQFVPCGGVDVKEETMSSAYLKAKDSSQPTAENFCDLLRFNCSKRWRRTGCKSPIAPILRKENVGCELDSLGMPPGLHNLAYAESSDDLREKDEDASLRRYSDQLGVALPDTMSLKIDRLSSRNSERSFITNRELIIYHNRRSGGDQRKSIPVFGSDRPITKSEDESPVNTIVLKGDQPMDFKEQLQLLAISSGQFEPPSQSKNKFRNNKLVFNFGNQNTSHAAVELAEEILVPTKRSFIDKDERPLPPERSKADWEKAFQCAVDESVTPPDFNLCLQQCLHCGRKFRPESLKVHRRSCNNKNRCKSGRSPLRKDEASTSQLKKGSDIPVGVES